ncbi:transglycosylase SLT domain-containing protein [Methylococcus sp. EFPC2]|uniref:transglycosylase SLT domain-containing protein n=1 Tax=Methylococcus sp. EFPC2 TaxID=2812648 RepID=UPI001F078735|nr:transglycosylase SLT domain-containing protein [Methylococcus sp. EFPC2]
MNIRLIVLMILALLAAGCATNPPRNTSNLCSIFLEKDDWYGDANSSSRRWGVPVCLIMAIINQESSFVDDAKPARVRFLGIPLWRPSSAYGYGQAKDETWDWYKSKTGNTGADRDEFADAADFVAWYIHQTSIATGIAPTDSYNQYLAYHEGQGGFRRGSWRAKPWLQGTARKVASVAWRYQKQLDACRPQLVRAE